VFLFIFFTQFTALRTVKSTTSRNCRAVYVDNSHHVVKLSDCSFPTLQSPLPILHQPISTFP
jgi:hypothetical protein